MSDIDPAGQILEEITEASADLREIVARLQRHVGHDLSEAPNPLTLDQLAEMLLTVTLRLIELNNDTAALRIGSAPKLSGS